MDRRAVELCRDVHCHLLDAAGLGTATLGFARRHDRVAEIRIRQLLDEQLLGRRYCCNCRCVPAGRAGTASPASSPERCDSI